ncbi:hypothetical protein N0V93_004647 [Gnomoniopsis smithogilvyi]|uniref:Cupin type-2 domain-containing protein n=1 Tax=Gnomoniopsis smithogilvyi TaxID=1191159 RepID=A0A9W8YV64_9PEZI|nr:hypothetical protein N0V93_004647 [Gnomoniopsis smithogilvyi]
MVSNYILPPGLRAAALRTIINPVTHETATFRRYMAETNQEFSEIDVTVRAGGGVPLHYHSMRTETFTAVSSIIHLQRGKEEIVLAPGETAIVPPGSLHRFWNPAGGDMSFTVRVIAAANYDNEGFEKGLYIWYGLARDGLVRDNGIAMNPLHQAVITFMQDTWIAGWGIWLLTPVFATLYAVARWTGVERELVKKYWTLADGQEVSEQTPLVDTP